MSIELQFRDRQELRGVILLLWRVRTPRSLVASGPNIVRLGSHLWEACKLPHMLLIPRARA